MGNDPSPRPGFNYWVSFPGQGKIIDPDLFEDGRLHKVPGYITDLLTARALQFLRGQRRSRRPFFLYFAHKAVHPDAIQRADGSLDIAYGNRYIAAARHQGRYRNEIFPRSQIAQSVEQAALGSAMVRRFLERKNEPATVQEFGSILDPGTSEQSIRDRAETMLSVDESLGELLTELEESGALENTVIIFTSDNGFFFGEHGLSIERRLPYEESIRAPLLIRYPQAAPAASIVDVLVSSIDIAPSILQFAGETAGIAMQGSSFLPFLGGGDADAARRRSVLIENFSDDQPMPWVMDADYKAIRTDRHKLIHWIQHPELDELYDLEQDPREEQNLIHQPESSQLVGDLRSQLAKLVQDSISL